MYVIKIYDVKRKTYIHTETDQKMAYFSLILIPTQRYFQVSELAMMV